MRFRQLLQREGERDGNLEEIRRVSEAFKRLGTMWREASARKLLLLLSWSLSPSWCQVSRSRVDSVDLAFLSASRASLRPHLRPPSILDPYTTAEQFVEVERRGQASRKVVGILVENFSRSVVLSSLPSPFFTHSRGKLCTYPKDIFPFFFPIQIPAGRPKGFA